MIARVTLVVLAALTLGSLTCLVIYAGAARLGVPHWVAVAVGMVVHGELLAGPLDQGMDRVVGDSWRILVIAIARVLVALGVLVATSFSCLAIYAYVAVPVSGIPDWVVVLTGVMAGMAASLVDGRWSDAWTRRRSIGVASGRSR